MPKTKNKQFSEDITDGSKRIAEIKKRLSSDKTTHYEAEVFEMWSELEVSESA